MENYAIGIIGMGDMGKIYAASFHDAGYTVNICDLPNKYKDLVEEYKNFKHLNVWKDGFDVSRRSDYILYSVETENIEKVIGTYGPSTKVGATVGGQTSVKEVEILALEKHLPQDVNIVTCHSLHGPSVNPKGQPLVIMRHRASDEAYFKAKKALSSLGSYIVELSVEFHDKITADTQAVTHIAFLSMGTAWKKNSHYPWLGDLYNGGIENVKVMTALRIYGSKWHVYAGLAIMNSHAKYQIEQYAKSASELFKLMIMEEEQKFRKRVMEACNFVFKNTNSTSILLSDKWLDQFSHLSLLAIVDCWHQLQINPYEHMICQTPPFRLWLGITEYLFKDSEMLESSLNAALYQKDIRADDFEFVNATQLWSQTVQLNSMDGYRSRFEETATFFRASPLMNTAKELSTRMMSTLSDKWTKNSIIKD